MSKANKLNCYGCLILGEDEWKEKKLYGKIKLEIRKLFHSTLDNF